tara:strand:- start:2592 stop:4706 length:2115 start_codon:yes stop_codon:yes gene_type:complete
MDESGNTEKSSPDKDKKILEEATELFEQGETGWSDAKNEARDDLNFGRLGDQWPPDIKQTREQEGRPCLSINDLPASIRQVVNDGKQNRPQIKVRPVDGGADVETADILSGLIKHIEAISDASVAYDTALDNAVSASFGFIHVETDYTNDRGFEQDLFIRAVPNALAVTWDASSEAMDNSDWEYAFISWMEDKKKFERDYPNAASEASGHSVSSYVQRWYDKDEIRLATYYRRVKTKQDLIQFSNGETEASFLEENLDKDAMEELDKMAMEEVGRREVESCKIVKRLISGRDILATTEWKGTLIPIIPIYGESLNVEGRRYFKSLIRDAKDAQRMFNLSRSTVTEMLGRTPKTPFIGEAGTFDADPEKWGTIHLESHPYIEHTKGMAPPTRVDHAQIPQGLVQESALSADDKKRIMGIHDANLGLPGNEVSGKALRYRRSEGDTSTFHFLDNQQIGIKGTGRVLCQMIPTVYNTKRVLRIIGDDGKSTNVSIKQEMGGIERALDFSVGTYDVVMDTGPSFATRREETSEFLQTFMQSAPQAVPILAPMMIKMMDFPDQDKTARLLETIMPPAAAAIMRGENPADLPPPPPPPEVLAEQAKAKALIEVAQNKAQADIAIADRKAEQTLILDKNRSDQKIQIEREQAQADMAVQREKHMASMELEREKALLKNELMEREIELKDRSERVKENEEIAREYIGAQQIL